MNQVQKPTYDELASAVLLLEEAWNDLFSQVCSNPVTNAWGKPVNFTVLNQAREQTSGLVYRLKELSGKMAEDFAKEHKEYLESPKSVVLEPESSVVKEEPPSLQKYLENFDEYSFTSLLLRDMVDMERRRQGKNCSEVQSDYDIEQMFRDQLEATYSPIDLAVLIVKALACAAKGDINVK